MPVELLDDCPRGDLLQQIDDMTGPQIERAVQKFLPRDLAREVRKRAIEFIGEEIRPTPAESHESSTPEVLKVLMDLHNFCRG